LVVSPNLMPSLKYSTLAMEPSGSLAAAVRVMNVPTAAEACEDVRFTTGATF
jgi:hypothetical protein